MGEQDTMQCLDCDTYVPVGEPCGCLPVFEKEPEAPAPFPAGLLERYQNPVVIPATNTPTEPPMADAITVTTTPAEPAVPPKALLKKVLLGLAALSGAAALALHGGTLDIIVTAGEQVLTFLSGLL